MESILNLLKKVGRFKKVKEGSRRFEKVQEGSRRFEKVREGSRRFEKSLEFPGIYYEH